MRLSIALKDKVADSAPANTWEEWAIDIDPAPKSALQSMKKAKDFMNRIFVEIGLITIEDVDDVVHDVNFLAGIPRGES